MRDQAERIRTLYQLMGLTQTQLATAAGVSQGLISQIHRGVKPVTPDVLAAIAQATGTPLAFFDVDPADLPTDTLAFRKKASASAKEVGRVKATAREAYRVAAELLVQTKIRRASLPRAEGDVSEGDIEALAERARDALGLSRDAPVGHVIRACERAGVPVVPLILVDAHGQGEEIVVGHSGVSCWRGLNDPAIISYFSAGSGDRQRFTVAHELGHLVLHPGRLAQIPPRQAEEEAHRFAGAFLFPRERAQEAFSEVVMLREFAELKKRWGVSIQALVMRAFQLGCIDAERRESLYRQIGARGWRTREPVVVHAEQPALMRAMLARRFGGQPAVREASEVFGLHPVLMRLFAPEVGTDPAPKRDANVITLATRRREPRDVAL